MEFPFKHHIPAAIHKFYGVFILILCTANVSNGTVYPFQQEIDTVSTSKKPVESIDVQSNTNPASNSLPKSTTTLKTKDPKVVEVYKLGHKDKDDKEKNEAGIGDIIVVKVKA